LFFHFNNKPIPNKNFSTIVEFKTRSRFNKQGLCVVPLLQERLGEVKQKASPKREASIKF
jgi:hypothetical protein